MIKTSHYYYTILLLQTGSEWLQRIYYIERSERIFRTKRLYTNSE